MNTLQRIIDPVPALFALAALIGVLLSGCASSGGGPEYPIKAFLDPVTEVAPDVR